MTSINEMAIEIEAALQEYSDEIAEDIKDEVKRVAKEAVEELKSTSPKKTGEYKKGWKTRVEYEGRDDIRMTVYNGKKGQLTHLLENGHAIKNGTGRTYGRTRAFPHIVQAEQHAAEKLENKAKVRIKG